MSNKNYRTKKDWRHTDSEKQEPIKKVRRIKEELILDELAREADEWEEEFSHSNCLAEYL